MKFNTVLAFAALSVPAHTVAQTERDLDSHEHGAASLNIGIDAASVFIELDTPWNNVIGFEHAPSSDEDHALLDEALALLGKPENLFVFNGAECVTSEVDIDSTIGEDDHDDEHHDDDAKHDDHDDEHHDDDTKHDDHDDEHHDDADSDHYDDHHDNEHADHDEDTHSSLVAAYSFDCKNADQLTSIDAAFMGIWSGFEEVTVQLIGPGGQALTVINAEKISIDTTPVQ